MKFAVPSYNRENVFVNKTLKTLIDDNVNFEDIDLFLYGEEQTEKYKKTILEKYDTLPNIITTDILDLGERLNMILNKHYEEGEEIVLIEDDVRGLCKNKEIQDIKVFCQNGFNVLKDEKLYLWGISPTDSTMFNKEGYTTNYKFIIGVLYGIIVRHDTGLNVSITYKQDFERTIKYFIKDGGMVRFNEYYVKTTYRAQGGLGNDNKNGRIEKEIQACKEMIELYPRYVYQNRKKIREIKLYRNPAKVQETLPVA